MRVFGWLCLAWLSSAALSQHGEPVPLRSSVSLVRLPVVVLSRSGDVVPNLRREDFEVLENGRLQEVTSFAEGTGGSTPLHLGLMLDRSPSMERDLDAASSAAVKLVDRLPEAHDVTLVEFDTTVRIGRFEPANYDRLFERIRVAATVGHGTALYDALGTYADAARERQGLHILVLYSDGGDSNSMLTLGRLMDVLRSGSVLVYAVGYLENQRTEGRFVQQSILNRIAHETGGEAFFPTSVRSLDRIYSAIAAEIRSRYTIGYVSSNSQHDKQFRKVEVRLVRRDLKGATVRTRSGYLAPG